MKATLSFEKSDEADVSIMVDVLRASSTISVALEKFKQVIPSIGIENAQKLGKKHHAILAGERRGKPLEGFDIGNSPAQISQLVGETLILTTSNGTRILEDMKGHILIGSFLNAQKIAKTALKLADNHVEVVMAGVDGRFAIEDFLGAGEILYYLEDAEFDEKAQAAILAIQDPERVDEAVWGSRSARNLKRLGFAEDIEYCLQRNSYPNAPHYYEGIITLK